MNDFHLKDRSHGTVVVRAGRVATKETNQISIIYLLQMDARSGQGGAGGRLDASRAGALFQVVRAPVRIDDGGWIAVRLGLAASILRRGKS